MMSVGVQLATQTAKPGQSRHHDTHHLPLPLKKKKKKKKKGKRCKGNDRKARCGWDVVLVFEDISFDLVLEAAVTE